MRITSQLRNLMDRSRLIAKMNKEWTEAVQRHRSSENPEIIYRRPKVVVSIPSNIIKALLDRNLTSF